MTASRPTMPTTLMGKLPALRFRYSDAAAHWGKTFAISGAVGVLTGLAAVGLDAGLDYGVDRLIGRFTHVGTANVVTFRWGVLLLPAIGGLLSGLALQVLCPKDDGHGTNQLIAAFHQHQGDMPLRGPAVKATGAIGVISCGGSAGPEGPIAALGAAIGSTFARRLGLTPRQRRVLLVAGCAGGVGAIFRCPLGGALFATSVLYREPEFEADAIVPAFVASVLSYSTFMAFLGFGHTMLHGADALAFRTPVELLPYVALGPLCGVMSIFLCVCLRLMETHWQGRLKMPLWLSPCLGGLLVGAIGCLLPQVMDGQYRFIQNAMDGKMFAPDEASATFWWRLAALFALVAVFKCIATSLTVGAGAPGGVLGPSVFIGGVVGAALGAFLEALDPGRFPEELRQALIPVGMAGVLAAGMRTPLASVVMVTEMTGSYGLIVPLMLVCITAYVVGRRWGLNPAQVRSSVESPVHAGDLLVRLLESMHVAELTSYRWPYTTTSSTTLGEIVGRIEPGTRPIFAVVDDGKLAGVISISDISRVISEPGISNLVIAEDMMTTQCTTVDPGADLYSVLETFKRVGHEALPVVDREADRYLGMLSRQAIHEAVRRRMNEMSRLVQREHAGLSAIDQDEQLYQLVLGVSAPKPDTIQRMPVPPDAVGKSLRAADFRKQYAAQVVAVQYPDGRLQCPPDIDAPLEADQMLLVIVVCGN